MIIKALYLIDNIVYLKKVFYLSLEIIKKIKTTVKFFIYYSFYQKFSLTDINKIVKNAQRFIINNNSTFIFTFFTSYTFTLIYISILGFACYFINELFKQFIKVY